MSSEPSPSSPLWRADGRVRMPGLPAALRLRLEKKRVEAETAAGAGAGDEYVVDVDSPLKFDPTKGLEQFDGMMKRKDEIQAEFMLNVQEQEERDRRQAGSGRAGAGKGKGKGRGRKSSGWRE